MKLLIAILMCIEVPSFAISYESQRVQIQKASFRYFCKNNQYYDYYGTSVSFLSSLDFYHFSVSVPPDYQILKTSGLLLIRDKSGKNVELGRLDWKALCSSHKELFDGSIDLDLKDFDKKEGFLSFDGTCDFGTWTEGEGHYVTGWTVRNIHQNVRLKGQSTHSFEEKRYLKSPLKVYSSKSLCLKAGKEVLEKFP